MKRIPLTMTLPISFSRRLPTRRNAAGLALLILASFSARLLAGGAKYHSYQMDTFANTLHNEHSVHT